MKLYWGSGSSYSWRALMTVEHKGIAYESQLISYANRDNRTDAFLAMSPRGKVPLLHDGEVAVSESLAIMAYLEAKHPTPAVFGATPAETAAVWLWVSQFVSYLEVDLQLRVVQPLFFNQQDERRASIKEALTHATAELEIWDTQLSKASYVVGDVLSAADIVLFPAWMSLLRAAKKPAAVPLELDPDALRARFANIANWQTRIEALPWYERTYPPHWREG